MLNFDLLCYNFWNLSYYAVSLQFYCIWSVCAMENTLEALISCKRCFWESAARRSSCASSRASRLDMAFTRMPSSNLSISKNSPFRRRSTLRHACGYKITTTCNRVSHDKDSIMLLMLNIIWAGNGVFHINKVIFNLENLANLPVNISRDTHPHTLWYVEESPLRHLLPWVNIEIRENEIPREMKFLQNRQ